MRNQAALVTLALVALFSVNNRAVLSATNRAVLHGRVFSWTTTGTAGTSGAAGAAGTTGAAGSTGGSATGGAATGGSATGGTATGGATGGTPGTGGGTGGATGGTGGGAGCGDGVVQPGESCDGSDLQSASCVTLGFGGGTLACSSTCQFDASACTGGTLTPTVTATVTSCAAPCGVFFDATGTSGLSGSDYVGANWTWDFRDVGAAHTAAAGFVAGHVFDTAGTYVVTTRARDLAGAAGWATTTITVAAWPYTTYYVSAAGSDSNDGLATTRAFATIAHALTALGSNKAILLRRGDTFSGPSSTVTLTGAELIGSYSDPAAPSSVMPIWTSHVPANSFSGVVFTLTGTNPRLVDFRVTATNLFRVAQITSATNAIVERVEATGIGFDDSGSTAGQNFYVDGTAASSFVFDNYFHNFNGYGGFAVSNKLAITGNTLSVFGGQDHGFRIASGDRTVVSQNTIAASDTDSPFSGITIRGDHTKIVVAQNNSNRLIEFTPQNEVSVEHVQDALCDGNYVHDDRASGFYTYGIAVTAKHVVVRNNAIVGSPTAVGVFGVSQLPLNWVDAITVYNNTSRFFPASYPTDFGAQFADQSGTSGSISVKNNIFTLNFAAITSPVLFLHASGSGTHSEDHNLGYDPNVTIHPSSGGSGDIVGNPQFVATSGATAFRIGSTSAARNTGTSTASYQDSDSVTRPKEGVFDIGRCEYYAP